MKNGSLRMTVLPLAIGFAFLGASGASNAAGPNLTVLTSTQAAQAIVNLVTSQEAGVESLNSHGNFIAYQLLLRERLWEFSCAAGGQGQVLTLFQLDPQNPSQRIDVENIDISNPGQYPSGADFVRICQESPLQRLSGVYEDTWSGQFGRHFVVAAQIEHLPFVPCSLVPRQPGASWSVSYTQYWPYPVMAALDVKTFLMSRRPGDDQFCSSP
jgi:hypothetical protein